MSGEKLPRHDSKLDEGFGIAHQCEPTPGRHTISFYLYGLVMGVDKQVPTIEKTFKEAWIKKEKILFGTLPQACSCGLSIARVSGCLGL